MNYIEFLNIFKEKNKYFMWFLGAGASVSAGVPTAANLITQFKINIFCKNTGAPQKLFNDLSNATTRQNLEYYFIENNMLPTKGENDYSYYFKLAYPNRDIRREKIEEAVRGRKPSYGQEILASMMRMGLCRCVWTTNFDKLIEDAVSNLYSSTGELIVSTLESQNLARDAINNERWPLLVKLHGDFQSDNIKNIEDELSQDKEYRALLIEQCRRYGLIVMGYSGRDSSIMDVFEEAIDSGNGFPQGLYWLLRIGDKPCDRLQSLIEKAHKLKINANIIEIQNFDETMSDLLKQFDNIPDDIKKYLNNKMPKATFSPLLPKGKGFPVIRLNALPIEIPLNANLIDCEIGGNKDVREIIKQKHANIAAIRLKEGVIAFGSAEELEKTFKDYKIKNIKEYILKKEKITEGQQELNLIYQLLIKCFENNLPIVGKYKNHSYFLVIDQNKFKPQVFAEWNMFGKIFKDYFYGTITGSNLKWSQAVKIKIEYRFSQYWLLLEPKIWVEAPVDIDEGQVNIIKNFLNNKYTYRYNVPSNVILDNWIEFLVGKNKNFIISLDKNIKDSPRFKIIGITAFTRRLSND